MSLLIFPSGETRIFTGEIPPGFVVRRKECRQHVQYLYLGESLWARAKQRLVNAIVRFGDWVHG